MERVQGRYDLKRAYERAQSLNLSELDASHLFVFDPSEIVKPFGRKLEVLRLVPDGSEQPRRVRDEKTGKWKKVPVLQAGYPLREYEHQVSSLTIDRLTNFHGWLDRCLENLETSIPRSQVNKCIGHVIHFLRNAEPKNVYKGSLYFQMPDQEYDGVGPRDLLPETKAILRKLISKKILEALRSEQTAEQAVARIEKAFRGAIAFPFRTDTKNGIDYNARNGRILVYLPGPRSDHWFQVSLNSLSGKEGNDPQQMGMVSVQTHSSNGKPLPAARIYFKDWWRLGILNGKVRISTRMKEHQDSKAENCYSCHKTGLNSISPTFYDRKQYGDRLDRVNKLISR